MNVDEALDVFQRKKRSMGCSELESLLEAFGFKIRRCSRGGHRVITHPGLPGFHGGSFDGGHGANSQIRPCYVQTIARIFAQYKSDLDELMERKK